MNWKVDWEELEKDFATPFRSEREETEAREELQADFVLLIIALFFFYKIARALNII